MNIRINEGYAVGKDRTDRYRFWRVVFETEEEATTFFCDDRSRVFEKWDDPDDDRTIFLAKDIRDTWGHAKSRLPDVLKAVFGPTTNIEFIEKKWDPVPGRKVTIRTVVGQGYRVEFSKRIHPEQAVALEEELAPEGELKHGIWDVTAKPASLLCTLQNRRKGTAQEALQAVTAALRKVLGENLEFVAPA